ncbi:LOW QUALITY PROTEIN: inositol hexakisphosphate and diphosphoinositol-pentakisphosphate kinase 1 [Scomber scombrus]|uniref:LOW QUALITY PROTEIN: inositol hexakisphosphate and diphosphoinositol-pentakisphosphate kinase 1 n=1 Tax=Scomber scombrus TaxID=13677 RepID=A0AAV1QBZ9_SCOSC
MVPSIYPLETLHNSLSLKQVNEFLTAVCESAGDPHTRTTRALSAMFDTHNQPSVDSYIPQRVLSSSSISLRSRSDRPPWCEQQRSFQHRLQRRAVFSHHGRHFAALQLQRQDLPHASEQRGNPLLSKHFLSADDDAAAGSQALDAGSNPSELPLTPNNSPEDEDERQAENPDEDELELELEEAAADPSGDDILDPGLRPPCSALGELSLSRMEGYCLPGSLPVLLELRESSSEAGSSSQTPQSPEGPDEFFDTQESMELWMDSPETPPPETTTLELGATHHHHHHHTTEP